jgi:hypothetical protein
LGPPRTCTNIDVSPTLVWSPNGQRLAFVSGDTDIYTVNTSGLMCYL